VDKGYQGVEIPNTKIPRSEQKRGITKTLGRWPNAFHLSKPSSDTWRPMVDWSAIPLNDTRVLPFMQYYSAQTITSTCYWRS